MDADPNAPKADRNSQVRPYIRRSEEMAREFKFKEAIAEWNFVMEHAVEIKLAEAHSHRGYLKFRALDYDGCINDCTRALEIDPDLPQALYNRAAANKEAGREEAGLDRERAALADLDRILKIDPRHELGLYLRAFLYGDTGQWERAISAWEPYILIKPQDWRPRLYRGIAFAESGKRQEAIQEYLKGTEVHPKMKSFYFRRSFLYKELNLPELAQKEWAEGMAIINEPNDEPLGDPRDPATHRAEERMRKLLTQADEEWKTGSRDGTRTR